MFRLVSQVALKLLQVTQLMRRLTFDLRGLIGVG